MVINVNVLFYKNSLEQIVPCSGEEHLVKPNMSEYVNYNDSQLFVLTAVVLPSETPNDPHFEFSFKDGQLNILSVRFQKVSSLFTPDRPLHVSPKRKVPNHILMSI